MDAAGLSLGSRESEITGIQVSADRVVPWRRRGMVGGIPVEMLMSALCQIPAHASVHTRIYAQVYALRRQWMHRNRIAVRLSTLIRREAARSYRSPCISVARFNLWTSNWSNLCTSWFLLTNFYSPPRAISRDSCIWSNFQCLYQSRFFIIREKEGKTTL